MKTLTNDEFKIWVNGGNIDEKIYFVVIKTASCPKCEILKNNAEKAFGELKNNVGWFVFGPQAVNVADIFANLNITSAPALIYRCQVEGQWRVNTIYWSDADYTDLRCIMDAIKDNDQSFFDFNEFDEYIGTSETADLGMNRLLHLIHGEIDPDKLRDRRAFKKNITI